MSEKVGLPNWWGKAGQYSKDQNEVGHHGWEECKMEQLL